MWIDLSKWKKDVKIFLSHVNAHRKVTLAEFSNEGDRMDHSISTQPLSLAIPFIVQCAHKQSGHSGRDIDYVSARQHELPFTKANRLQGLLRARSYNSREQH